MNTLNSALRRLVECKHDDASGHHCLDCGATQSAETGTWWLPRSVQSVVDATKLLTPATLYRVRATFKKTLGHVLTTLTLPRVGYDPDIANVETDMTDFCFQSHTLLAGFRVAPRAHVVLTLNNRLRLAGADAHGEHIFVATEAGKSGWVYAPAGNTISIAARAAPGAPPVGELELELLGLEMAQNLVSKVVPYQPTADDFIKAFTSEGLL